MASSFLSQVPVIVHLLSKLQPRTVLDIGKGFGKYGFLLHEYLGIDSSARPDPELYLRDQSRVTLEAVECNSDYLWPHIDQLYKRVYRGRIETLYGTLPPYDVVLMADVIEHLKKEDGISIVRHFIQAGSSMVISTPRQFFQQELFGSADERHISHWTLDDFRPLGNCDYQNVDAGRVFLISPRRIDIRGFGRSPLKRLRRIARAVANEL